MKKYFKIVLFLIITFVANTLNAQTITFKSSVQTIASGTIVTFETTGESASKFIGSVPFLGNTSHTDIECSLYNTDYYSDNGQKGKFQYKISNSTSSGKTVTITFNVLVLTTTNNGTGITSENVKFTHNITVGPQIIPEISNNIISLSAPFSSIENINVDGTIAQGGNGVFQTTWKIVDNNGNIINNIDGITSLANKWTKDNIFKLPIQNSGEVYLSRVLTSGGKVSESNKVLISNWDGNFSSLNIKIKGPLVKYDALSQNFIELPQGTEINYNELAPPIPDRTPINNDIYLGHSPTNLTELTLVNPVSQVNYRWYYLMSGISQVDFGTSGTGTSLIGTSISSVSFPMYGYEHDQIHIYGSDGSRKIIYLTKVNQLVN